MKLNKVNLQHLSEDNLLHIWGGASTQTMANDFCKEDKNLIGAAITGAIIGAVDRSPAGPLGTATGVLVGVAVGIGGYMDWVGFPRERWFATHYAMI